MTGTCVAHLTTSRLGKCGLRHAGRNCMPGNDSIAQRYPPESSRHVCR